MLDPELVAEVVLRQLRYHIRVAGLPSGVPDDVPHIIELAPSGDGKTQITVTEDGYTSEDVRAQSEIGQAQCLDKMQALFKRASDTSAPR